MNFRTALLIAMLLPAFSAMAGEMKTVTLTVDKMTCGMCPITVKMALKNVEGVADVTTIYEGNGDGWAKVTYDTDKADIEDLTFATEMAGYPSRLKQ
jgi:mercuric ion binding protein